MTLIDEVKLFAREYINIPSQRTRERKAKIAQAYKTITGRNLKAGCSTCYIEAVLKILKFDPMATSKYEIKRGAVVQVFGHPEYAVTNLTITDEKGDWYVKNHPEKLKFFVRYPKPEPPAPPQIPIVQVEAVKKEVHAGIQIEQVPVNMIAEIELAQKEVTEIKKTVRKRSKNKK